PVGALVAGILLRRRPDYRCAGDGEKRQGGDGLLLCGAPFHRAGVRGGEGLSPAYVPQPAQRRRLSRQPPAGGCEGARRTWRETLERDREGDRTRARGEDQRLDSLRIRDAAPALRRRSGCATTTGAERQRRADGVY